MCAPVAEDRHALVHGLWVWKTPAVHADKLRDFCQAQRINEVYLSFNGAADEEKHVANVIAVVHRSDIQVEALLSADGEKLLERARAVVLFNEAHPRNRFDAIHLDVEPQQRPENKGAGNLRFLPTLVAAYREVRKLATPSRMTVNADIPTKFLKGSLEERRMLLSALPRFTLMLYELSSPGDGETARQKTEKLSDMSQKYFDMAYAGLNGEGLAQMGIGLRWPDYGELLPAMLESLDRAMGANPHYLGWAWHSYDRH
jgi:hypothetical protein